MPAADAIVIAEESGANEVSLYRTTAPYPIPRPQAEYGVEVEEMRRGTGGAGFRLAMLAGASLERADLEMVVAYVTSAQITSLEAKYFADPPAPVKVSLDDGDTWYLAVWQKNGYVPGNWESDHNRQQVTLRFHFLKAL